MKPFSLFLVLATATCSQAAVYTSNFNSGFAANVAGWDGWTINDSTASLSFAANWNGTNALALGGLFDAPTQSVVSLAHAYGETIGRTSADFAFTIADSNNQYPGRDTFGFSFKSGATNLFSVIFVPSDASNPTPGDNDAVWTLYAVTAAGTVPLSIALPEGGTYAFDLDFSPNGSSTNYTLNVGGLLRTGTIAVDSSTVASSFALEWDAAFAGSNYFVMDNLTVVPEPSSLLLCGLAGLGFVSRRKRA